MLKHLLIIGEVPSSFESSIQGFCNVVPGLACERIGWEMQFREYIRHRNIRLLLVVALKPVPDTLSFFDSLREKPISTPILAVVPDSSEAELLRLACEVSDDFIVAPVRSCELQHRVARILGKEQDLPAKVHDRLVEEFAIAGLVGRDPAFLRAISRIPVLAKGNCPVLIAGESGTGKELCARAIHSLSSRRNFPFIPIDCAALPDQLFENELFGHVRGAFTDARRDQKGLISLADGGTLFLDEVDSLSASAQSKLLRFLQDSTYRPLGSDLFFRANLKVVAATNHDLEGLVRTGRFRSDLFFRLNVLRLYLVPLRERREDIALIARYLLDRLCVENDTGPKTLAAPTLRRLTQYDWPGNVRELYNILQRAVVFSEGKQIRPSDIEEILEEPDCPGVEGFRQARLRAIERFERSYVEDLMDKCNGNVSHAARLAKKDRRAFGRLVKRYDIRIGR